MGKREPCDDRGRDWSEAAPSPGLLATPEAGREAWTDCPQSLQKESALPKPRFSTSGPQNRERLSFCVVNHLVCGTLLRQP